VAGFVSIEEQFKEMAMKTIAEFNADLTQWWGFLALSKVRTSSVLIHHILEKRQREGVKFIMTMILKVCASLGNQIRFESHWFLKWSSLKEARSSFIKCLWTGWREMGLIRWERRSKLSSISDTSNSVSSQIGILGRIGSTTFEQNGWKSSDGVVNWFGLRTVWAYKDVIL
jgi:hypothetical protein